jgi:hypothetical protein
MESVAVAVEIHMGHAVYDQCVVVIGTPLEHNVPLECLARLPPQPDAHLVFCTRGATEHQSRGAAWRQDTLDLGTLRKDVKLSTMTFTREALTVLRVFLR